MAQTFAHLNGLFNENLLNELSATEDGSRFIKLRSLNRPEHLRRLYAMAGKDVPEVGAKMLFQAAYNAGITIAQIEACARAIYKEDRALRKATEEDLLNQLYRVQEFSWGGLHQNNLEKTIVDNYVKRITSFDILCSRIEKELLTSLRGYVICSWYNHWTSILIEDIFKDHPAVLPAVGLVKKIDFFVKGIPFDLKVTYLPEGYLIDKRRAAELRPELTLLKQACRASKLPIPDDLPNSALLQDLWLKAADAPDAACQKLIQDLQVFRQNLCAEIAANPNELIKWLYENQGDRRFDASNRLYVILVDERNYFESWKLKRAKALMEANITERLDLLGEAAGRKIKFHWEGKEYEAVSDVILVRHTNANVRQPTQPEKGV